MQNLQQLQERKADILRQMNELVERDVDAALAGQPIANSGQVCNLGQEMNILHAAIARLRHNEQR